MPFRCTRACTGVITGTAGLPFCPPGLVLNSASRTFTDHEQDLVFSVLDGCLRVLAALTVGAAAHDVGDLIGAATIECQNVIPGTLVKAELETAVEACPRHRGQHLPADDARDMEPPRLRVERRGDALQPSASRTPSFRVGGQLAHDLIVLVAAPLPTTAFGTWRAWSAVSLKTAVSNSSGRPPFTPMP